MLKDQITFGELNGNSSSPNCKEPIFRVKKLQRKGLLEKKEMQLNKTFIAGKWDEKEQKDFIRSCYIHGPHWKKIKADIKTRTMAQIRSHARKYMLHLCKKYGIKLVNKKNKRYINKKLSFILLKSKSKAKESIANNFSEITREENKFLKEFNFYIKKYDERLYSIIYADEMKCEEKRIQLQKEAKDIQVLVEKSLDDIIEMNMKSFTSLFG